MTTELEASEIWSIVKEIQLCKRNFLGNFLRLGTLLILAQEEDRYRKFAAHIVTFNDFLQEMDIKKSSAYNCIAVKRHFGEEILANNIEVEPTRLVRLLPLRIPPEERISWLKKAANLPAQAFDDELREQRGKGTTDTCPHEDTEAWERCKCCGKFLKT